MKSFIAGTIFMFFIIVTISTIKDRKEGDGLAEAIVIFFALGSVFTYLLI